MGDPARIPGDSEIKVWHLGKGDNDVTAFDITNDTKKPEFKCNWPTFDLGGLSNYKQNFGEMPEWLEKEGKTKDALGDIPQGTKEDSDHLKTLAETILSKLAQQDIVRFFRK